MSVQGDLMSFDFESDKFYYIKNDEKHLIYAHPYKVERYLLKHVLEESKIKYTNNHYAYYTNFLENIKLKRYTKSNKTTADDIFVSVRQIIKMKENFVTVGILTKVESGKESGRTDTLLFNRLIKEEVKAKEQFKINNNFNIKDPKYYEDMQSLHPQNEEIIPVQRLHTPMQSLHTPSAFSAHPPMQPLHTKSSNINNNKKNSSSKERETTTFQKLLKYLDKQQVNTAVKEYPDDYLNKKLNLLEFMLNKYPEKIKNPSSYLYMSIFSEGFRNSDQTEYNNYVSREKEKHELNQIKDEYMQFITSLINIKYNSLPEENKIQIEEIAEQYEESPLYIFRRQLSLPTKKEYLKFKNENSLNELRSKILNAA